MRKVTCPHCHGRPPSSDGRTECGFCDGGFIEEPVALSSAGRAGLVEPNKPDSKDQWFLAAVLWAAVLCLGFVWFYFYAIRCLPEQMNEYGLCEIPSMIPVVSVLLPVGVLTWLIGYFCAPSQFSKKRAPYAFQQREAKNQKKKDTALRLEKAKQARWESYPKVVCPHCTVQGSVHKYFPAWISNADQMNADFGRAIGSVFIGDGKPKRGSVARDVREIREHGEKPPQPPNMKCHNCNMHWSG
jgi:hypothetical protein